MDPGRIPEVVRSVGDVAERVGPAREPDDFFLRASVRRLDFEAHGVLYLQVALR